jgi:RNA polymerase sigma-70 factor (ECF subfamily)
LNQLPRLAFLWLNIRFWDKAFALGHLIRAVSWSQCIYELDLATLLSFNRHVLPADDVTSITAIGGNGRGAAFATTDWTVVLEAQGSTPAAQRALEHICRTYWEPIYRFVRRQVTEPEEAKDLTQSYFALLLERRDLHVVRKEKGRLRSYLLTSLKHFLSNERSRAMALKRGAGQRSIRFEDLLERDLAGFELADTSTAEQIYERGWALALLDQVLTRLGEEYRTSGLASAGLFDRFQILLTEESDRPSQAEVAGDLGTTENAIKQAFHRFRHRYRELLREEIAQTVMLPGDIEDELRHLIAVLRA